LAFMDALGLETALLAGFDWGGRAACIVAALWPERVVGLVSGGHPYNIHDIPHAWQPAAPEQEARLWYQYYFHTERGRLGLEQNRKELACYLWQLWSPSWDFDAGTFTQSAEAFDNPDFVEVVIHSYRHRYASVAGDPAYDAIEKRLEAQPLITVPTRVLLGANDGVFPTDHEDRYRHLYGSDYQRSLLPGVGHNAPQEAPGVFAEALLELAETSA
jgi:pimeloyl-ACP methyl ester carboxylesterase